MALFFNLNIEILYISLDGISSLKVGNFGCKESYKTEPVRLLLSSDGFVDCVYEKTFIKTAGVAQSIVLDVIH